MVGEDWRRTTETETGTDVTRDRVRGCPFDQPWNSRGPERQSVSRSGFTSARSGEIHPYRPEALSRLMRDSSCRPV
jgi:hypothetical protein